MRLVSSVLLGLGLMTGVLSICLLVYGRSPGNSVGEVGSMMAGWAVALGVLGVIITLGLLALAGGLRVLSRKRRSLGDPDRPANHDH
jgi:hypothetical protein